ncbi:Hypothetical protein A7982_03396 [Minicystis rosea]|nr:Hypothetical protein A7982_03396 [Minicystis rosea]
MKDGASLTRAQMIAKAWLDEGYRTTLVEKGIDVPARPDGLEDAEIDALADARCPAPPCATFC